MNEISLLLQNDCELLHFKIKFFYFKTLSIRLSNQYSLRMHISTPLINTNTLNNHHHLNKLNNNNNSNNNHLLSHLSTQFCKLNCKWLNQINKLKININDCLLLNISSIRIFFLSSFLMLSHWSQHLQLSTLSPLLILWTTISFTPRSLHNCNKLNLNHLNKLLL